MQNTGRATAEKSFIVEALIISLSNFVVKIIGVLFKIPMTYILGVNMGIFNAAYSIYAMLFMLSTAGCRSPSRGWSLPRMNAAVRARSEWFTA